jgi:hypothetical protein
LTSKISRTALIAAVAVGASGLVAVPAASAADTQYFVNAPVVTGVSGLTPESVVLNGAVDTGGNPGISFSEPAGTNIGWPGGVSIINSTSGSSAANETFFIGGIPDNGSSNPVTIGSKSFSNSGADNYSNVEFEVDPVSDYVANGNTPGSATIFGASMEIPTQPGLTNVKTAIGAFGTTAQASSNQTPLTPGTKYYYWIVDQPGTTDNAEDVNTGTAASPSYSCYPDAYVAQYLAADSVQGPCIYQYGNLSGIDFYQSPNGEFTTPALGKLNFGAGAAVTGNTAMLRVTDASGFTASAKLQLKIGASVIASAKLRLPAHGTHFLALTLNGKGVMAAERHASARIVLTANNYGQLQGSKSLTLLGQKPKPKKK